MTAWKSLRWSSSVNSPAIPVPDPAASVSQAAYEGLMCCDAAQKCEAVFALARQIREGTLDIAPTPDIETVEHPGRPARPRLVAPKDVARRSLTTEQGRAAFIHAITHIEFNAINLALDALYRFQGLPRAYYLDWSRVALEEAQHFLMLQERLQQVGSDYGTFDAHNGLWDMAVKTRDSLVARMALVPRVLEARGLDVTPGMIRKLRAHGDGKTAEILEVILEQEISHVAIGSRWFRYACEEQDLEPEPTFQRLLAQYYTGRVQKPLHLEARRKAGFSESELAALEKG